MVFRLCSLFAETDTGCVLGASALGNRNVSTREVGLKAANELVTVIQQQSCVDLHTQDQVICVTFNFIRK